MSANKSSLAQEEMITPVIKKPPVVNVKHKFGMKPIVNVNLDLSTQLKNQVQINKTGRKNLGQILKIRLKVRSQRSQSNLKS